MKSCISVLLVCGALASPASWSQPLPSDGIRQHISGRWGKSDDAGAPRGCERPNIVSRRPDGSFDLFGVYSVLLVEPLAPLRATETPYVLMADEFGNVPTYTAQQFMMPDKDTLVTRPLRATGVATEFKRCPSMNVGQPQ